MAQAYAIKGKELRKPYHYTQCGLDDVYLLNGYKEYDTDYGKGVAVERVEELQHAIAKNICLNKAFMTGEDFRFLRKLLDLTQVEVANRFGCNVQAVARWEKGKTELQGPADRLMRLLYLTSRSDCMSAEDIIRGIAELDTKHQERQVFEETKEGWRAAA